MKEQNQKYLAKCPTFSKESFDVKILLLTELTSCFNITKFQPCREEQVQQAKFIQLLLL